MPESVCRVVKKVACNVDTNIIQACVVKTLLQENKKGCVTIVFVSQSEIAQLNQQFRNNSAPTDVLSFPTQTTTPQQGNTTLYLGEIVILSLIHI